MLQVWKEEVNNDGKILKTEYEVSKGKVVCIFSGLLGDHGRRNSGLRERKRERERGRKR